jgi:hypothetical protein
MRLTAVKEKTAVKQGKSRDRGVSDIKASLTSLPIYSKISFV